jgi:AcrR family transcriptional regulator
MVRSTPSSRPGKDEGRAPAASERTGAEGRARILDAAEELMAERGVFAVSLREINSAAGQRNASSVQYHFGGRDGLVQAVVERHMAVVDARRNALCDAIEAEGRTDDVRALVRAVVEPLAERLTTPSGRRYLRILPQLAGYDEASFAMANRSLVRVGHHLAVCAADLPPRLAAERTAQVASFLLQALADHARRLDEGRGRAPVGRELFVSNLVDVLVVVVSAPASPETRRLLQR